MTNKLTDFPAVVISAGSATMSYTLRCSTAAPINCIAHLALQVIFNAVRAAIVISCEMSTCGLTGINPDVVQRVTQSNTANFEFVQASAVNNAPAFDWLGLALISSASSPFAGFGSWETV